MWSERTNLLNTQYLRKLCAFGWIFAILYKGDNFWEYLFALLNTKPLLERVYFKKKEFAPTGSKFFHFRVDPCSKGSEIEFDSYFLWNGIYSPYFQILIFRLIPKSREIEKNPNIVIPRLFMLALVIWILFLTRILSIISKGSLNRSIFTEIVKKISRRITITEPSLPVRRWWRVNKLWRIVNA